MPKKSKKEKILAEARRKKQNENLLSYNFVKPQSTSEAKLPTEANKAVVNYGRNPDTKIQTATTVLENSHLKKDLIKILIFTIFAVSFQLVIYYFNRS